MKKSAKVTFYVHIVLMSFILAMSIIGIILNPDHSARSVYVFNMVQATLFLIIMKLGNKFIKKSSIEISNAIYIILVLFCSAHFFLGEIINLYAKVSWWDGLLHAFSGMLISFLSFSLITIINDSHKTEFHLNIAFSCIFAFSLAISIGVLWEIIEFASDKFFLTNMQRAYESTLEGNSRGVALVGQAALVDTMKDLMLDSFGSFLSCLLCALFCKKKQVGIDKLSVIKIQKSKLEKLAMAENKLVNETSNLDDLTQSNNSLKNESISDITNNLIEPVPLNSDKNP